MHETFHYNELKNLINKILNIRCTYPSFLSDATGNSVRATLENKNTIDDDDYNHENQNTMEDLLIQIITKRDQHDSSELDCVYKHEALFDVRISIILLLYLIHLF